MFTPSNILQNYLNAQPRDVFDIIGALMGYINADPAFRTNDFEQAIQYTLDHGVSRQELFAAFDQDMEFEEDSSKWNEEYYSYARVYLKDNFCEKRVAHVKAVARKLYPAATQAKPTALVNASAKSTALSNARSEGVDLSAKKAESQQYPVGGKSSIPAAAKAVIAVAIIVLLALIIGLIVLKR